MIAALFVKLAASFAPAIPGFLLRMAKNALGVQDSAATSEANADRDIRLKQLDAEISHRQGQRDVVIAGMAHPAFWRAWSLFTLPLGVWFAAVVIDSLNPVVLLVGIIHGDLSHYHIDTLPASVQELVEAIISSVLYGGGVVAAGGLVAGAISRRK